MHGYAFVCTCRIHASVSLRARVGEAARTRATPRCVSPCTVICVCLGSYAYICVHIKIPCVCGYVRVSARLERRARARPRVVYIYMCMCEHICIRMSAHVNYMGACACVRAHARAGVSNGHLYNVRLYRRSCIEACTDAQMRTRTRTSAVPCAFGGSHTLVHARMDGCIFMRVSMARYGQVFIGVHVYVYI